MASYTEEDVKMTNRQVNLSYLLAGCLKQSCEAMDKYLIKTCSDLKFNNKRLIKDILNTSGRLHKLIEKLEDVSILTCDDDAVYRHDDAIFKYYALFMRITQILGSDDKTELRALMIYNHLGNFEKLLDFERLDLIEKIAFYGTKKRLADGTWSIDEARTCIKLKDNENDSKKSETY